MERSSVLGLQWTVTDDCLQVCQPKKRWNDHNFEADSVTSIVTQSRI